MQAPRNPGHKFRSECGCARRRRVGQVVLVVVVVEAAPALGGFDDLRRSRLGSRPAVQRAAVVTKESSSRTLPALLAKQNRHAMQRYFAGGTQLQLK